VWPLCLVPPVPVLLVASTFIHRLLIVVWFTVGCGITLNLNLYGAPVDFDAIPEFGTRRQRWNVDRWGVWGFDCSVGRIKILSQGDFWALLAQGDRDHMNTHFT
jgi:hypothetical protein